MFSAVQVFPGVTHITDAMGVSFTLIEDDRKALLFDTGYGLEDVCKFVQTLTDKPLKVYLSHGHHDHMLGARWFSKTYLCKEDMKEFTERTGEFQRRKVMKQAMNKGVYVPEDFMTAAISLPARISFNERFSVFESLTEPLGGTDVKIIRIPGHTPGSIVIYIPAYCLLLTGDDWNPCTWMWFPSSLNAREWRNNMHELIRTLEDENNMPVRYVICSHQPMVHDGCELKAFLAYISDERLDSAPAVDMGAPINTHQISKDPENWVFVYDYDKIR